MSNVPHCTFNVQSSVSCIKPSDRVKAWIQQVEEFEPVQEDTNQPSTPDQGPDRHRLSANCAVQDGTELETRSFMLSRSRKSGIRSINSEQVNLEATGFVTLSRSYVPSNPSRTPKKSVPTVAEGSQSASRTPQTRFRKLKAKDPANTSTRIKQEPPDNGDNDNEEHDSLLGKLRNLKLSPQSTGTRSIHSPPGSPPPVFNETRQQQLAPSIRFTGFNAIHGAPPSEVKSEDDHESKPEPEIIVVKSESAQEQNQKPENQEPKPKPITTISEIWSHMQIDEATNWRDKHFRNLLPQAGPPCQNCHHPSVLQWVIRGNPNGNGHRPFYRCLPCKAFTTWGDVRGVKPGNQLCDCGKPSRESVTGRRCRSGVGLVYWSCAETKCRFFVWK